MISVVTPTIRPNGLEIVAQSLQKQTYVDWEWIICSPFDPQIPFATWVKDNFTGGYWTLNRAYNRLFEEAKADIVVSWQDFIHVPPMGLEMFYDGYVATAGLALISGVGDQYRSLDRYGKPIDKIWNDPRKTMKYGSFYECYWNDIEFNWAMIPKKAFFDVGGFDEQLDFLGYGGDQLQFVERINETRFFECYLDQANESYTLQHTRDDFGGQEQWDTNHVLLNGKYHKRKEQLIAHNMWPKLVDKGRTVLLEKEEEVK